MKELPEMMKKSLERTILHGFSVLNDQCEKDMQEGGLVV